MWVGNICYLHTHISFFYLTIFGWHVGKKIYFPPSLMRFFNPIILQETIFFFLMASSEGWWAPFNIVHFLQCIIAWGLGRGNRRHNSALDVRHICGKTFTIWLSEDLKVEPPVSQLYALPTELPNCILLHTSGKKSIIIQLKFSGSFYVTYGKSSVVYFRTSTD